MGYILSTAGLFLSVTSIFSPIGHLNTVETCSFTWNYSSWHLIEHYIPNSKLAAPSLSMNKIILTRKNIPYGLLCNLFGQFPISSKTMQYTHAHISLVTKLTGLAGGSSLIRNMDWLLSTLSHSSCIF